MTLLEFRSKVGPRIPGADVFRAFSLMKAMQKLNQWERVRLLFLHPETGPRRVEDVLASALGREPGGPAAVLEWYIQ